MFQSASKRHIAVECNIRCTYVVVTLGHNISLYLPKSQEKVYKLYTWSKKYKLYYQDFGMEHVCPLEDCKQVFPTKTQWRNHVSQEHPDLQPFQCDQCMQTFKHEANYRTHMKKGTCPKKRKEPEQSSEIQQVQWDPEKYKGSDLFYQWCLEKERTQTPRDYQMNAKVRIDIQNIVKRLKWDWFTSLTSDLIDEVDFWEGERMVQDQVSLETVSINQRHIWWYIRFLQETGQRKPDQELLDFLDERVRDNRKMGAQHAQSNIGIKLWDPYVNANNRNEIVRQLARIQQEQLDPFMYRYFSTTGEISEESLITFGLGLRCWIELAIRFTGIPLRIQATKHLVTHTTDGSDNYVAKLQFRCGQFTRLVHKDKVGMSHKPQRVFMGPQTVDTYLWFYKEYCRPKPSSPYVFQTRNGGVWNTASKDVKKYLKDVLGINVDQWDPTGRFIHASRTIMLSYYSLMWDFDMKKLQRVAVLMRHSIATMERFYNVWHQWFMGEEMNRELENLVGRKPLRSYQSDYVDATLADTVQPLLLLINQKMQRDISLDPVKAPEIPREEQKNPITPTNCRDCKQKLCTYGPHGTSRNKAQYARFWEACINAECPQFKQPQFWHDLGYFPFFTYSQKVRHVQGVLDHIKSQTGKDPPLWFLKQYGLVTCGKKEV